MSIPHAFPGQPVGLLSTGAEPGAMQSTALFKTGQLEVIRLVLPKGKAWPAHKVPGEIIVQCLAGAIDFTSEGSSRLLLAGQLLYLPGGVVHGLGAVEDAIVLLTIALHR